MSGVLDRAAEFFLAPPEPARESVVVPPAVRAVVLGSPADAPPLAAALALALRAADRSPATAVACWGGGGEMRATAAARSAARLANRLTAHELTAAPRGRLAWIALPPEPPEAVAAVRRASAIVDGPLVTALGGASPPELDDLVAEHDLAVIAVEPDTSLARAAIGRLAARGIAASTYPPLRRGLQRALALAGLTAPRLDVAIAAAARAAPTDEQADRPRGSWPAPRGRTRS